MTTTDDRTTTTATINGRNWRKFAACRNEDPELFFPIGNTWSGHSQAEDAKAVCFSCLVIDRCLRWALDTGQDHGVCGGMTEEDRRSLKRQRARARQRAANAALLDGRVSS